MNLLSSFIGESGEITNLFVECIQNQLSYQPNIKNKEILFFLFGRIMFNEAEKSIVENHLLCLQNVGVEPKKLQDLATTVNTDNDNTFTFTGSSPSPHSLRSSILGKNAV